MHIPQYVQDVISTLEAKGFEAYLVGGCVRDALLCRDCFDYDITTSALPSQVKSALFPIKVIDTGIAHGTVTTVLSEGNIEITTFRGEGIYTDHRHPDSVLFSNSLCDDLKRRDFTINSLAYNEKTGLIDLFSGKNDLELKLIRTVKDANERFNEDALRILRALRFSSCLGFEIEEKTATAIHKNYKLLSFVSKERIYSELKRLVCGENAPTVLTQYFEVFNFILEIPETEKFYQTAAKTISNLPSDENLRIAGLFANLGLSKTATILSNLKSDTQSRNYICTLINHLDSEIGDKISIKKLMSNLNPNILCDLIILKYAAGHITKSESEKLLTETRNIIKNGECYCLSQLKISGDDLYSLGFSGKQIGDALNLLLDKVICGEIRNERCALIGYLKK